LINNPHCRVEKVPFKKQFEYVENPLSVSELNALLEFFPNEKVLSVTGGEPLEQNTFLQQWLPTLNERYRVLLETAGVHVEELLTVFDWIDIISMDIKLPSVTGLQYFWEVHRAFAEIAREKELYIKVIVSSQTDDQDLQQAVDLVAELDPEIPFVLQPATSFAEFSAAPTLDQLACWQRMAESKLSNVRLIPQIHKILEVL
jgi:organic radical activating enzyme